MTSAPVEPGTTAPDRPAPPRLLVVTAVAAERDAVAAGLLAARRTDGTAPRTNADAATAAAVHGTPPAHTAVAGNAPADVTTSDVTAGDVTPADAITTADATTDATASDATTTADVIAGGVGPAAAAAATATALARAADRGHPYGLVVSAGIGGGFAPAAPVGSVAVARTIVAADLGVQTPEGFVPVAELGFGVSEHRPPARLGRAVADGLGAVYGPVLTVSTVTGSAARAAELTGRHPSAVAEAMEGFGVAEAAAAHGVPVLEIRAVSNAVGPRDRAAWRIGEALAALTTAFGRLPGVLEDLGKLPGVLEDLGKLPGVLEDLGKLPGGLEDLGKLPGGLEDLGKLPGGLEVEAGHDDDDQ